MAAWTLQRRQPHLSLYAGLVANLIKVVGRDTRPDRCGGNVQDLARQPADGTHRVLAFGIEEVDFEAVQALFGPRNACLMPVGASDGLRNGTPWRERIDGLHGPSEGKGRERIVGACVWIGRRHDLGGEELVKHRELSLLLLVYNSVLRLGGATSAGGAGRKGGG
jgi:hypothetical protein